MKNRLIQFLFLLVFAALFTGAGFPEKASAADLAIMRVCNSKASKPSWFFGNNQAILSVYRSSGSGATRTLRPGECWNFTGISTIRLTWLNAEYFKLGYNYGDYGRTRFERADPWNDAWIVYAKSTQFRDGNA